MTMERSISTAVPSSRFNERRLALGPAIVDDFAARHGVCALVRDARALACIGDPTDLHTTVEVEIEGSVAELDKVLSTTDLLGLRLAQRESELSEGEHAAARLSVPFSTKRCVSWVVSG
jgi:hypothetical protein